MPGVLHSRLFKIQTPLFLNAKGQNVTETSVEPKRNLYRANVTATFTRRPIVPFLRINRLSPSSSNVLSGANPQTSVSMAERH